MRPNIFYRLLTLLLVLTLAMTLTACSNGDGDESGAESSTPTPNDQKPEYPEIDYLSLDLSQYVTLGQYKDITIGISKKTEVTDADIMKKVNDDLIYNKYTVKVTDRAVTKNDTVSISFVGLMNGTPFQGGTGDKDYFTIYDGGGFIDGFADGLVGAMPGTETDVNVTFPENYHSAEMAGKPAVFKVTVHHIYEAAELTDEIASEMTKGNHKTAQALIDYYGERLRKEKDAEYEEKKGDLAWGKVIAGIKSNNIPKEMVDQYYDYEIWWASYYAQSYNMDVDTFLSYRGYTKESLRRQLENDILTNMIVYSIMKAENITVSDEEYAQYIAESGYTEAEWLKQYTKEELEEMFLYTKTYDSVTSWQNFVENEPVTE